MFHEALSGHRIQPPKKEHCPPFRSTEEENSALWIDADLMAGQRANVARDDYGNELQLRGIGGQPEKPELLRRHPERAIRGFGNVNDRLVKELWGSP